MSFSDFGLDPALLQGIEDAGFTSPTTIQSAAIPPVLAGNDLLAAAETGSGKTAAFVLPIFQQLLARPRGATRALILTPTRELAAQIDEHAAMLAYHSELRAAPVYGGVPMGPQERALEAGVDLIVATPGRLLDHCRHPYAKLDQVEIVVLDEADRMLDMGFLPDIRRILRGLPARKQTLLFSATLPAPIVRLANDFLRDPVRINVDRKAAPASGVTHHVYPVRAEAKAALLVELLERGEIDRTLAFTRTRDRADRLARYLDRYGIPVALIHGERSQAERTAALNGFKNGRYRVLVATDVAARGIDVFELPHVVNVDVPHQPEDYIHRVGRTARAEALGDAHTFVSPAEASSFRAIERAIGQRIEPDVRAAYAPEALAAPAAAEDEGAAAPAAGRGRGRGRRRGASRPRTRPTEVLAEQA